MADKGKRRISDKVPKNMLRSAKELPIKNGAKKPPRSAASPKKAQAPKAPPPKAVMPARGSAPNRPAPQRPINPQSQKAVAKAMRSRLAPRKRRRYRGGSYILYYLLAAIIIVIILVILSNTVLFRCSEIEVRGNLRYSAEEIIGGSGLKQGDNLLHVNTGAAAEKLVGLLTYVDKAEVKRSFPTKLIITVDEAEKWYALSQGGAVAAVSRMGKILEQGDTEGLTVVKGFDAESMETGKRLKSKTDGKDEIPQLVLDAAEKAGLEGLDEIDMTDKFSVKLYVDGGRVLLELGPATNVDSKLSVAAVIIKEQLGAGESVTLLLTNPERVPAWNKPKPPGMSSSPSSASSKPSEKPPETSEPDTEEPYAYDDPQTTEEQDYGSAETGE